MKPTVYVLEVVSDDDNLMDVYGIYSTKEKAEQNCDLLKIPEHHHYSIHEMIMDT